MSNFERMESALRRIGYSAHTGSPRFGPKAQTARWGLGEDELPDEEVWRGIPSGERFPIGTTNIFAPLPLTE